MDDVFYENFGELLEEEWFPIGEFMIISNETWETWNSVVNTSPRHIV